MTPLDRALAIAREAHVGQVDKAGRPYIEHVLRVVDAVEGEDAKVVAALHDVLEDADPYTGWNCQRLIREGFTDAIVLEVATLTRPNVGTYERYIRCIEPWPIARAVKIADLRDNSDPARLALLPERERERLARKYAAALRQLGADGGAHGGR